MNTTIPDFIIVVGTGLTPESFGDAARKVITHAGSQMWGTGLNRFRGTCVLLLYKDEAERVNAFIAARQLVMVTGELRLAKIKDVDEIDVNAVYKGARTISDYIVGVSTEEFLALAEKSGKRKIHPAQDCDSESFSTGVYLNGERYLLTSKHELMSHLSATSIGIELWHNDAFDTRMSHDAVTTFMTSKEELDTWKLFQTVRQYIRAHIYLSLPEMYDVLTVWVIGTYVHTIFRYFPYLHFHAEKGSGKTLLEEILALICFNGTVTSSPNGGSLLRLISQSRSTLFIDEAESFAGSSGGSNELMSILKTGFNSSGDVVRGKEHYSTYGPKCFASINNLNDVLADRTIEIRLLRKTDRDTTCMYRETPEMLAQQQIMRDQLYLYGLRYAEEIAAAYNKDAGAYDSLPHLTNRAFDIWVPLFKIAATIGSVEQKHQIFNSLDKYSQRDCRRRQRRDADENESVNLLLALQEMMLELKPVRVEGAMEYYDPDAVHFFLQRSGYLANGMQKKALSRLLNRTLEIESVPKAFGELTKRMYAIDRNRMAEYSRRYGLESLKNSSQAVQDDKEVEKQADAPGGPETTSEPSIELSSEQPEAGQVSTFPRTLNELFPTLAMKQRVNVKE
jgi:hypothetical protein